MLASAEQDSRRQLLDQLSKSQRARCVPLLKNGQGSAVRPNPSWQFLASLEANPSSPSPSPHTPKSSHSSADASTHVPATRKGRSLPGQVLASTNSRTCAAATHFRASFKTPTASPVGKGPAAAWRERKTEPSSEKPILRSVPRLPGRVLEDTQSRTCAAAHLPHQDAPPARSAQSQALRRSPRDWQSKVLPPKEKEKTTLAWKPESPRSGQRPASPDRAAWMQRPQRRPASPSPERLPRPTQPKAERSQSQGEMRQHVEVKSPPQNEVRLQSLAEARYQRKTRLSGHESPGPSTPIRPDAETPQHPAAASQPEVRIPIISVDLGGYASSIRVGTPTVPPPSGHCLPSWATTDAGLSPFHKKLAHFAAEKIQRAWRRWWLCNCSCFGPQGLRALRASIVYVQRWWRDLLFRKLMRRQVAKVWRGIFLRAQLLRSSANRLQRGWRMHLTIRWRLRLRQAAEEIQRAWRRHMVCVRHRQKRAALQQLRSFTARKNAASFVLRAMKRFCQVQREAAICLQSQWHGLQIRRRFAGDRDQLLRARDRREIIRRKAQLLEGKASKAPTHPSLPPRISGPGIVESGTSEKPTSNTSAATPRDGRMQSRSKRLSLGSKEPPAAGAPRTHSAQAPAGSISMAKFLASQNALSSSFRSAATVDVPVILRSLLSRGLLSSRPHSSPFSAELGRSSDLEAIHNWLASAMPSLRIRCVLRVECSGAAAAAYSSVSSTLGPERLLWHGTSWDCVGNIAQNGFNRGYSGRHGSKLGRGSYFAEEPAFALRFCGRREPKAIFLAGVLAGRICRGAEGLVEPPADTQGSRYDSTVDDPINPKVFCVFRDFQAIPLYLAEISAA